MIVALPVQVPVVAVRVCPSVVVPVIAGRTVLAGGSSVITTVAPVVEDVVPATFVAVTTPRIVEPTSVGVSV